MLKETRVYAKTVFWSQLYQMTVYHDIITAENTIGNKLSLLVYLLAYLSGMHILWYAHLHDSTKHTLTNPLAYVEKEALGSGR